MNKKVRKSTSIVSGVLISTSLINNAVSLASVGSTAKAGVAALGKGVVATAKGGIDLLVVPAIKGVISWVSTYLFVFLLVYGFYYNKCVLHTGKASSSIIKAVVSLPGLVSSGIKTAINYVFDEGKKPDGKNEVLEAKEQEKDVEVISVEDVEKEIDSIERSLSEYVSKSEEEIRKKIEVLKKRLEATRGSLIYKLNWLKFQLGAPFRSETRKQYSDFKTHLEDISLGLDTVTNITKKWEGVRNNKGDKLSLLLLEESREKENPLVALLQEVKQLEGSENSFLKQYSQTFFKEYIKELEEEVFKEFKRIVKMEEKTGSTAFGELISKLDILVTKENSLIKETNQLSLYLRSLYYLITVEEQALRTLKDCGLNSPSTAKQLLNFVFGKDLLGILGDVFVGLFAADDNINKPKKELKDEDLLTILEKIGSKKSDLMTLKGAITSAINNLKKIGKNDFSKSILEKAEKTEKMLGSLFEEKGGEVKENNHLISVATKYAEFSSKIKKIEERKFDNEGKKELNNVLTLLVSFYDDKLKDLDNLLTKISTFEVNCNKDFVGCLKGTVLELKNRYDSTKTALHEFSVKVMHFSSYFESDKEKLLGEIAKKCFLEKKGNIDFVLDSLESSFEEEVCVLKFGEIEEVKDLWTDWKKSFISKYQDEVNKKVEALEKEAKEKEEQEKKNVGLIKKTKEAINSFKLLQNFNLRELEELKQGLKGVSKEHTSEAKDLERVLDVLKEIIEFCLSDKCKLSEKIRSTLALAKVLRKYPAFFESVVTYLSGQFDVSAKEGYDKDFYKLLLSLKDFEKVPEGNSEGGRVSSLLNKFYAKVKDVVVKKAKESIKNNEDLVNNFDKEFADNYKNLTNLKVCAEGIEQSSDLKNLALFFFECSRLEKYIVSSPIASQIPFFTETIDFIGGKLNKKFSSIKLDEFLLNFFTLQNSERNYFDAFTLCLNSPELNFFEIKNVENFFALGNDKKNFDLLLRVRVNLQSLQQSWNRSNFCNAEINLKTVLELLSKFKGNEEVIQSIKSAVVSYMSNFSSIFIDKFLEKQELKIFSDFSDETFAKLFEFFDTPEALNSKNSKEIKRSWFLYLFGFYYKTRGPLSSNATKYADMITKSKLIKEEKEKLLILKFFNTLDGGTEQHPALSDKDIGLGLDTFFRDDKDFAKIAYGIFASYKKEFRFGDVINDTLNTVGSLAGKGVGKIDDIVEKGVNFFKGFGNLFS